MFCFSKLLIDVEGGVLMGLRIMYNGIFKQLIILTANLIWFQFKLNCKEEIYKLKEAHYIVKFYICQLNA